MCPCSHAHESAFFWRIGQGSVYAPIIHHQTHTRKYKAKESAYIMDLEMFALSLDRKLGSAGHWIAVQILMKALYS
jgi:hypothetical protein